MDKFGPLLTPRELLEKITLCSTIMVTIDAGYSCAFGGRWVSVSKTKMREWIASWAGNETPRFSVKIKDGKLYVMAYDVDDT